jgi:tRNA (guanine10-N2)-dimethyltransferase
MKCHFFIFMIIIESIKEDLILARAEIEALSDVKFKQYRNFFFSDCDFERLSYMKSVFRKISIKDEIDSDFNGRFKFLFYNIKKEEKEFVNGFIKDLKNKGAVVDLANPEKIYALIRFEDEIIFTEKIYDNPNLFLNRHPKLRPGFHPGACKPRFARLLVNLTGLSKGKKMLDPFCGTGGILFEARDIGLKVIGYDIEKDMVDKTKINLDFYGMNDDVKVYCKDAFDIDENFDAIVTEFLLV